MDRILQLLWYILTVEDFDAIIKWESLNTYFISVDNCLKVWVKIKNMPIYEQPFYYSVFTKDRIRAMPRCLPHKDPELKESHV